MSIRGNDIVICHNVNGVGHGRRGPFSDAPPKYKVVFEFSHRSLKGLSDGLASLNTTKYLDGVFGACQRFPNNGWQIELGESYSATGLRPLRVSDVVILDGKAWRVEPNGWSQYEGPLP